MNRCALDKFIHQLRTLLLLLQLLNPPLVSPGPVQVFIVNQLLDVGGRVGGGSLEGLGLELINAPPDLVHGLLKVVRHLLVLALHEIDDISLQQHGSRWNFKCALIFWESVQ